MGLEIEYNSVRGATDGDYTGNGCVDVSVIQANDWVGHVPQDVITGTYLSLKTMAIQIDFLKTIVKSLKRRPPKQE